MKFTRTLRAGMTGEDVAVLKNKLMTLGVYDPSITEFLRPEYFGGDTVKAVKRYQLAHGLVPDGIVGILTWSELFGDPVEIIPVDTSIDRFGDKIKTAIMSSLEGAPDIRREMCLDILKFPVDPNNHGKFPLSLYIRGGNIYNTDLRPNIITIARIRSGAARQPEFYDGGRQEMMENAVAANPLITGADCSGGVVGEMRRSGVEKATFDLSADGFASKFKHIDRADLQPADLLHKPGHIGMYVGGGYAVEWAGGAYGCQLTKIDGRRVWDYVKKRYSNQGDWVNFLHSKRY